MRGSQPSPLGRESNFHFTTRRQFGTEFKGAAEQGNSGCAGSERPQPLDC